MSAPVHVAAFAAGLPADEARSLAGSEDRMIPPHARRAMAERAGATVPETGGHHLTVPHRRPRHRSPRPPRT
ncbi:hypothetical protein ACWGKQ_11695 [Streptomyces sp. NPDC054770]